MHACIHTYIHTHTHTHTYIHVHTQTYNLYKGYLQYNSNKLISIYIIGKCLLVALLIGDHLLLRYFGSDGIIFMTLFTALDFPVIFERYRIRQNCTYSFIP
jgi:hypothetical protein